MIQKPKLPALFTTPSKKWHIEYDGFKIDNQSLLGALTYISCCLSMKNNATAKNLQLAIAQLHRPLPRTINYKPINIVRLEKAIKLIRTIISETKKEEALIRKQEKIQQEAQ